MCAHVATTGLHSAENRVQMPLVEVDDLEIGFRHETGYLPVVRGVSLNIKASEMVALVGESGCGKSLTSMALGRLLPRDGRSVIRGDIRFAQQDVMKMSEPALRSLRRHDVAYIFQEPSAALNPVYTIGFQLYEVLDGSRASRRDAAIALLGEVGLDSPAERLNAYPHEFSGGMQQRVMIAMALARRPRLLIADEPTTALDVTIQSQILLLLKRLQAEYQMAVLLITHNLGIVAGFAQRVYVMYAGRIVEEGEAFSVLRHPAHPYTAGLIGVVPRMEQPRGRLEGIPGSVPDAPGLIQGCPFAERCARRRPECTAAMPQREMIDSNHSVACFHPLIQKRGGES